MISVIGQFFKNIFTSTAGMAIGIIISFFFTPYLISRLGKDQYGLWTLVFSLVAYMRLADMGIQQSLVRYVSKYYAARDWTQLNQVISSSARMYLFISTLTIVAALIIDLFILQLFKIPAEYFTTTQIIVLVLGANLALYFATIPFCSLGPFHRFDIVNYFLISTKILETLGIIVLLEFGLGLIEMAVLILALNFVSAAWRFNIRKQMFPEVQFSKQYVSKDKTREMMSYGIYSFLMVIAWTLIFQTDNLVIGGFLSTADVAVFSVPAMIITQLRNSIMTIATPLIPAISHFEALNDFKKIMDVYSKSTRYLYYLSGFLCIVMLFFGGPFILLWVKKEFVDAIEILYILIIGASFTFPQIIANSVLMGISKHRLTFYILGAEALANIILSVILVQSHGIVGVAYGTAIPQLIIYIFIYPVIFYRAMKTPVRNFYSIATVSSLKAIVLILPSSYIMSKLIPPDTWLKLIFDCTAVSILMLIGLFTIILEKDDRERVAGKFSSIIRYIRIMK
ncbi:MAG: hypothetical protein CVT49_04000 [candidate division Zixibacteria bacterium HGW-Zixibacteria-1]|nr:MAG: hypothetical protein CVT49_04000 [candidate division Zixibacteria bacterium HGW-Zixibacteria-1]